MVRSCSKWHSAVLCLRVPYRDNRGPSTWRPTRVSAAFKNERKGTHADCPRQHSGRCRQRRPSTRRGPAENGALQSAIFNSANFSSIATDATAVIQIFNVGAERMLGYAAAEVLNTITPADISDPGEVIVRAAARSVEFGTPMTRN
jgi:PAS domain-containing protein